MNRGQLLYIFVLYDCAVEENKYPSHGHRAFSFGTFMQQNVLQFHEQLLAKIGKTFSKIGRTFSLSSLID